MSAIVCGCSGVRSCLVCEGARKVDALLKDSLEREVYQCYKCGSLLYQREKYKEDENSLLMRCNDDCQSINDLCLPGHVRHGNDETAALDGVVVIKNFVSIQEEEALVKDIDSSMWAESQSGRRKQDYGPKVNFKKRKVKLGAFNGLPSYSEKLVTRMADVPLLNNFNPVELCNLDYNQNRGSSIDPHLDDSWIWGERLVTINLLSPTYLTFSHRELSIAVHVPLPRLSLVVVMGVARHVWCHSIRRENIVGRRVAMTMRELGSDFLAGNRDEEIGKAILKTAGQYRGIPINFS